MKICEMIGKPIPLTFLSKRSESQCKYDLGLSQLCCRSCFGAIYKITELWRWFHVTPNTTEKGVQVETSLSSPKFTDNPNQGRNGLGMMIVVELKLT